jgi:hypothetical protein
MKNKMTYAGLRLASYSLHHKYEKEKEELLEAADTE